MTEIDVKSTIANVINKILTDSGRPAKEIGDDDILTVAVGLDSLDLAVLVVSLEQQLGVDPFRDGASAVPTFGQLVAMYEKHIDG